MGLERFRDAFVRELSTGTRRIVDLACQVAHRPTVILLDEPSSGIAQREVEALAPVLRRLRDEMGAALVVIEHDIPLVSSIADRLVALDLGRVIATGPPDDGADPPASGRLVSRDVGGVLQRSGTGGKPCNQQVANAGRIGSGERLQPWRRWGPIAGIAAVVAFGAGVLVATEWWGRR